jgi:hypothetical protein
MVTGTSVAVFGKDQLIGSANSKPTPILACIFPSPSLPTSTAIYNFIKFLFTDGKEGVLD